MPSGNNLLAVIAYYQRRGQPKSGTDWRDVTMLLLAFPELKKDTGIVSERLKAENAGEEVINLWHDLVKQEIQSTDDDGY